MPLKTLDAYVFDATTTDGRTIHIRPIAPDDAERMLQLWDRLSPETVRMRFFAPTRMTAKRVRYFTDVDYDRRVRGTPIETSPKAALAAVDRLAAGLVGLAAADLEREVLVVERLAPADQPVGHRSTIGRELAFVLSHTIHHQAMIGLLLAIGGAELPDRFGYAPSTPAA